MDDKVELHRNPLAKYVEHLERGAATHAAYAKIASEQALYMEKMSETPLVEPKNLQVITLAELANLQASVHTLGLTVALAALAQLAAAGVDVPEPPEIVPIEEEADG